MNSLGMQVHNLALWRFVKHDLTVPSYLMALMLGTIAMVAWVLNSHSASQVSAVTPVWLTVVAVFIMLFPASEAALRHHQSTLDQRISPTQTFATLGFCERNTVGPTSDGSYSRYVVKRIGDTRFDASFAASLPR